MRSNRSSYTSISTDQSADRATSAATHAATYAAPTVLYQSATLLAVDKPAGIIVHGDGTDATTLTDLVQEQVLNSPASERACSELQALNRLDRATSGIVLFSLNKETQALYDRMIAEHRMSKHYYAIVRGQFPWSEHTFTGAIGRDRHDSKRMRVSKTGKSAITHVKLLKTRRVGNKTYSLLDVSIETGRKHQIRVHLSSAGFPLVGDELYGRPYSAGFMLHAYKTAFLDPVSHEQLTLAAPVPERFLKLFPRADFYSNQ